MSDEDDDARRYVSLPHLYKTLLPYTIERFIKPGEDRSDPAVQVRIGLRYMRSRYGDPTT